MERSAESGEASTTGSSTLRLYNGCAWRAIESTDSVVTASFCWNPSAPASNPSSACGLLTTTMCGWAAQHARVR
eukprot:2802362-Prymnesium_polylepis.1